ncbi:MAG: response regulator transcription factor [Paludibacteraceae bacterium]|nr:response regulator transcription factor [Paludibacteraceae bacterium]
MKLLIVDDELHARTISRGLLEKYFPEIVICTEAASVEEAYQAVLLHNPDLILLDVDMPDGSAFDFLHKLTAINFSIIFITAYEKYALQAIKFSALDYLLKPFSEGEFAEAIRKAQGVEIAKDATLKLNTLLQNFQQPAPSRIVLRTADSMHVILIDDIIRLQGDGAYCTFFLNGSKSLVVSKNLKEYENLLENCGFIRTHQSHLINSKHLICYHKSDGGYLSMSDKTKIPVATRYKEKVIAQLSSL